jgi:uncharacterized protein (TIGR00730 family)
VDLDERRLAQRAAAPADRAPVLASICVFCGANPGASPAYAAAAAQLGRALGASGRRLVYGGGHVGLMGAVADAALAAGGEVVGVMPQHLVDHEIAHRGLTELRVVQSMHERKAAMAELAEGFAVLPGGLGTLEEFFEIWTWGQLGLHRKPYGLLNVAGFFDPLLAFLDHAVGERFVRAEHRALLVVESDAGRLLERLDGHAVPVLPKWLDRTTT